MVSEPEVHEGVGTLVGPEGRVRAWTGTLRGRLTLALLGAMGGLIAASSGAVVLLESRAMETQLDAALRAHAASEVLTATDRPDRMPHLHDATTVPVSGSSRALEKFAALYDDSGQLLARTSNFGADAPARNTLPSAGAFDLSVRGRRLRAVLVPAGTETPARVLLLAVPRADLDAALQRLVALGGAAALGALVLAAWLASMLARWLTRDLVAIAAAARAVAAGELHARVGEGSGARELRALARDLDEMFARLEMMVATQRRFVSDAAHELRAPLTALRGELELTLRRPRSAEDYRAALERAAALASDLAALVNDLLALARARTESRARGECAAVSAALARVSSLVGPAAQAREVRVVIEAAEGLWAAITPRHLESVVRNLAENAVRHAPPGSEVGVRARREGAMVEVSVTDAGPGVPLEQAERVFEPFVRLDPARGREGGAGLGLAIARETARAHGGDVVLDVGYGPPGARFVARLLAVDQGGQKVEESLACRCA